MDHRLEDKLPLIAILRGLEPAHAVDVAWSLLETGFEIIEVPMNSPEPCKSIESVAAAIGDRALVGAGTVLTTQQVDQLVDVGARLMVSPNCNQAVIAHAAGMGMVTLPGVFTASEMFAAIEAGASGLKIFPAELMPPAGIRAVKAVLPPQVPIFVVGGIHAGNMREFLVAGAAGFGMGSSIFEPGKSLDQIAQDARAIVEAFKAAAND